VLGGRLAEQNEPARAKQPTSPGFGAPGGKVREVSGWLETNREVEKASDWRLTKEDISIRAKQPTSAGFRAPGGEARNKHELDKRWLAYNSLVRG
jgi:hypothetical protein